MVRLPHGDPQEVVTIFIHSLTHSSVGRLDTVGDGTSHHSTQQLLCSLLGYVTPCCNFYVPDLPGHMSEVCYHALGNNHKRQSVLVALPSYDIQYVRRLRGTPRSVPLLRLFGFIWGGTFLEGVVESIGLVQNEI